MSSNKTQAILLLTAHFSGADDKDTRPLGIKEWADFAFWLNEQKLSPEQLLSGDLAQLLKGWQHKQVTLERLHKLLNRATSLGLAMEKWTRAGLWVLTRSDAAYPSRLKKRLGNQAPPVLFGCGNPLLLQQGGIAVVGSRNASEQDLHRSRALGAGVAAAGLPLVSGGARGVDESAMLGSLAAEGSAVGVLSCDLLKTATSAKYRRYLMQDELVLISPFYPEAGFNAGNAMQRNKYIYCLADAAIVVHSGTKGGTWEGALEDLKQKWVPLWVLPSEDKAAGNAAIVQKGAQWLEGDFAEQDLAKLIVGNQQVGAGDLLEHPRAIAEEPPLMEGTAAEQRDVALSGARVRLPAAASMTLYECFLQLLQQAISAAPQTVPELEQTLQIHKTQLTVWLKQAAAEGKVHELKRPKRYQWSAVVQDDLFGQESGD
jgi:predicted Rossmann fold nucleotide-binding protein DprA/Smf involved in DNA uptake